LCEAHGVFIFQWFKAVITATLRRAVLSFPTLFIKELTLILTFEQIQILSLISAVPNARTGGTRMNQAFDLADERRADSALVE
jgi:hypothetical protein